MSWSLSSLLKRSFCRSLASSLSCFSSCGFASGGASITPAPVELCCSSALAAEGGAAVCLLMNRRIIKEKVFSHKRHKKHKSDKANGNHQTEPRKAPLKIILCFLCLLWLRNFLWLRHHVDRTDTGACDCEQGLAAVLVGLHPACGGAQQLFAGLTIIRETGD